MVRTSSKIEGSEKEGSQHIGVRCSDRGFAVLGYLVSPELLLSPAGQIDTAGVAIRVGDLDTATAGPTEPLIDDLELFVQQTVDARPLLVCQVDRDPR